MFSGIVTARGRIAGVKRGADRLKLVIQAPYDDLAPGESVAVSGACLTVVEANGSSFAVEVVTTTRGKTRLAELEVGDEVNLERAVQVGDRLGGHFVQGHVDGLGTVIGVREVEDALLVDLELPAEVAEITVPRGSIALDGVSLTVSDVPAPGRVEVALIPHTRQHTTLGALRAGDRVHVEGDLIGKVVRQLMNGRGASR